MKRPALIPALVAAALLAPAPVAFAGAAAAGPPSTALGLRDARLGMGFADWRNVPYPERNPRVTIACSDDPDVGPGAGLDLSAADRTAGLRVCAYVARYGKGLVLPEAVEWRRGLFVQHPTYAFAGGRLSRIRFQLSVDDFDEVMALFKDKYGPPGRLVRDTVQSRLGRMPRVQAWWRTPLGVVHLVDPLPSLSAMQVTFAAPPAGAPALTSAAAPSGRSGARDEPSRAD